VAVKRLAGMDVASTGIKVVELESTPAGPRLQHIAIHRDGEAARTGTLPPLAELKGQGVLPHGLVATIPFPEPPAVDFCSLPPLPGRQMAASLRAEVAQAHGLAVDEIVLCHQVLKRPAQGAGAASPVMTVFCPRRAVEGALAACTRAGLQLVALDARELAFVETLLANYEFAPDEPAIAVEIGQTLSFLVLVLDGEVRLVRRLNVTGQDLHNTLKESFDLDPADLAARVQQCHVFPKDQRGLQERNMLGLAAEAFAEQVVSEIRLAMDFCLLNLTEDIAEVRRILLSGGVAKLKGLDDYVAADLGVPVEILDPLRKIEFDFAVLDALGMDQIPEFSVAVGLALRKVASA